MRYCSIISCENNRGIKDNRLLVFSTRTQETNAKWKEAIEKLGLTYSGAKCLTICMLHFRPSDICGGNGQKLKRNAIPSLRTRPFNPTVKTRDKSYEIQQMNAPTPSFDPLKCEPTDKIVTDESTIPLRIHSNHNSNQSIVGQTADESIEIKRDPLANDPLNCEPTDGTIESTASPPSHSNRNDNQSIVGQTADESIEIKRDPLANDPLNCEPTDGTIESTASPSSHSIHNDNHATVDQTTAHQTSHIIEDSPTTCETPIEDMDFDDSDDDIQIQNQQTTTDIPSTECTENQKNYQHLAEENRKLRAELQLLKLTTRPFRSSPQKQCEVCLTSMPHGQFTRHLCPNQVNIACEYCDVTFISMLTLRKHLWDVNHTNIVSYQCSQCTLAFPMRKLLEIHQNTNQTHTEEVSSDLGEPLMKNLFKCGRCGFSTPTAKGLNEHMKRCLLKQPQLLTLIESQEPTRPRLNPETSPKIQSAQPQVLAKPTNSPQSELLAISESQESTRTRLEPEVPSDLDEPSMKKFFKCGRCSFSTQSPKGLNMHIALSHRTQSKVLTVSETQKPTRPRLNPETSPKTQSSQPQVLTTQINSPQPELLTVSESQESTRPRLELEVPSNLDEPLMKNLFKCGRCGFSSPNAKGLNEHMKRYFPPKPKLPGVRCRQIPRFFECHICKCQLENHFEARKHAKLHVAARNVTCKFCCERYTSNELMEWHICGTNDMQFQQISCEYCDQSFQSLEKCVQHLETVHTDQSMHRCRKCARCFGMLKLRDFHEKYFRHPELGSFQCEFCSNIFERKDLLNRHMGKAHPEKSTKERPFLCTECGKGFGKPSQLQKHSLSHFSEPTIQCPKCPTKFRSKANLKLHSHIHQNLKFKCNECNCTFKTSMDLEFHIKRAHKNGNEIKNHECQPQVMTEPMNSPKSPVLLTLSKCEFCRERYTSDELLEWHICGTDDMQSQRISCEYCDQSFQSVVKCVQHLEAAHADDQSMHRCRKCARYFGMLQLRDFHEKYFQHPELGSFQCEFCSNTCERRDLLNKHMTKAHPEKSTKERPFLCTECGKCFEKPFLLRKHSLSHGEPTIQCPKCPTKFRSKENLKQHSHIHQNLNFKCNECNCTCKSSRDLEFHIKRVHKNKSRTKKFECKFCDLKFTEPNKLKSHLRTHTGEKPFECEFCLGRFFKYKGDLTKHLQTHLGDNIYKCDVCEQGFRYKADLRLHSFEHYKNDNEKVSDAAHNSIDAVHTE